MKCSIEYSDVRNGRKELPHLANAGDDHRVMQRRERIKLFHLGEELITEERGFCEFFAAMNNTMRHDAHFTGATDNSRLFRSEFGDHRLECCGVIAFFQVALQFALRSAMFQSSAIEADAFNKTFRVARFIRRVVK